MVTIGERDEATLAHPAEVLPVVETHLQRHFHGRGAVVGEEHLAEHVRAHAAVARGAHPSVNILQRFKVPGQRQSFFGNRGAAAPAELAGRQVAR